jgi:hypothetical protein
MTRNKFNVGDKVAFKSIHFQSEYRTGTGVVMAIEDNTAIYSEPRYGLDIIETSHPFFFSGYPHFWEYELTLLET